MDRAKQFREAAARANVGRDRVGWRYPAALRRLAVEYCQTCRLSQRPFTEIAKALGVTTLTLGRWLEKETGDSAPRFREVVVESAKKDVDESQGLTMIMPSGVRIEGLDLSGVVKLSRMLE